MLLSNMTSLCAPGNVITLPAAALAQKGLSCTTATCKLGAACFAVPATLAQFTIPGSCIAPFTAGCSGASSHASRTAVTASLALMAPLLVALL